MTTALSLINLVKRYKGFTLGPLNLDLEPGIVLGLVGPNGAGKTTTINLVAGLIKPDEGSVRIFGRDAKLNDPKWRLDIGYVGDTHAFYEYWSGERNLKFLAQFYPSWNHSRVEELAKRFKLDLKKRVSTLSKGNRAKLALIGALGHEPKLLLLDEPTSGLDPVVRAEFLETLWEIVEQGESAVVYSTHILSDISRIADELAFLEDGKIILRDTKDSLADKWRRISFRCDKELPSLRSVVNHRWEGADHLVISSNYEETVSHLRELGATSIEASMVPIDEIAVHILKGNNHVEAGKS